MEGFPLFSLTFDHLNVALAALDSPQGSLVRLEPVRNDQLPAARHEHPRGVPEEQRLVREMAEGLGDPHGVKGGRVEARIHLLGVELEEPDFAAFGPESPEGGAVVVAGRARRRWFGERGRTGTGTGTRTFALLFAGQPIRDRDLSSTDGDAGGCAPELSCEMARRAADAAADVEHRAVGLQVGDGQEELDQIHLPGLLGVLWGLEVCVVDMLAPKRIEVGG